MSDAPRYGPPTPPAPARGEGDVCAARSARASLPGGAVRLIGAGLLLTLLWNLPVELGELHAGHFLTLPLEVAVILGLVALTARTSAPTRTRVAHAVAAVTVAIMVFTALDLAVRLSLGRPLSPYLDLHLAPSLIHLLTGTLEGPLAWLALLALVLLLVATYLALLRALRAAQRALALPTLRRAVVAAALAVIALAAVQAAAPGAPRLVSMHASATLHEQWQRTADLLAYAGPFRQAARADAWRDAAGPELLAGLRGADVLLMYVESYGRSALEDPRYAGRLMPRLEAFEQAIHGAGLAAASGWLTSPTVGGQSWLAHGTVQSGLWLAHHRYYQLLLTTGRLTLTEAFNRAGYRTTAWKPAITMAWPEGLWFGYDRIYAAADLGYRGLPYNWVTMPDQYTLAMLERSERPAQAQPLFAEVSLISSHAPWTPIPPVLEDWGTIGDGRIFSRWAKQGDPPEVLWRDVLRVREHYALSLDYVLGVLASYAERFVGQGTVLIMVGDHQSAPLITGDDASRDVPMHVVSGDPALLEPFLDWGFVPGMAPAPDSPVHRMDAFRDWFLKAYSHDSRQHAATP